MERIVGMKSYVWARELPSLSVLASYIQVKMQFTDSSEMYYCFMLGFIVSYGIFPNFNINSAVEKWGQNVRCDLKLIEVIFYHTNKHRIVPSLLICGRK